MAVRGSVAVSVDQCRYQCISVSVTGTVRHQYISDQCLGCQVKCANSHSRRVTATATATATVTVAATVTVTVTGQSSGLSSAPQNKRGQHNARTACQGGIAAIYIYIYIYIYVKTQNAAFRPILIDFQCFSVSNPHKTTFFAL
jgi:hypothetical protein